MRFLSNKTLSQQILIIFSLFTLIPITILSIVVYKDFSKILFEMTAKSSSYTVNQIDTFSKDVYKNLDDILTKVILHPDVQNILKTGSSNDWSSYQEARLFQELSNQLLVGNPEVERISIYNFSNKRLDSDGHFLSDLGLTNSHDDFNFVEKLHEQSTVTSYVLTDYTGEKIISFGKKIVDIISGETLGIAVLDFNLNSIKRELDGVKLLNSGYIVIVNQYNEVIYHPNLESGSKFNTTYPTSQKHETYVLKEDQDGNQQLYFTKQLLDSGWMVIGIVPYDELIGELKPIKTEFFIFIFIILMSVIVLAVLIRFLFIKPIYELQTTMNQVQSGNFNSRVNFKRKDEIGKLGSHFNEMVEKINELIEKVYQSELKESKALILQKQAEIETLQEKITPHFLYNTLNSISWYANRKGIREIQLVVDHLSQLLRYSLKESSKFVPLKDEYEHLILYGEIIDFRYEGDLKFDYTLPVELQNVLLPKLLLQPIVENSIKHAFEDQNHHPVKKIEITSFKYNSDLIIEIKDNGKGIPFEQLIEMNHYLTQAISPEHQKDRTTKGMGLVNVQQRIKLHYGDEFGLEIKSEIDKGTTVRIQIPIKVGDGM